jgi:hypothetical protein
MHTDDLICHDLLRQCEEVAVFVEALRRVACQYAWRDVEPYAEEAWSQISRQGLMWAEIRDFVREAWVG